MQPISQFGADPSEKHPASSSESGGQAEAVETAAAPHATALQHTRHSLGNSLHGILLQVWCARLGIENGDMESVEQSLAQIEKAVAYANTSLDELRALCPPAEGAAPGATAADG
ncbi:MAG: hypothetical protein WD316_07230 [Phycisphaeraceae bacterium]